MSLKDIQDIQDIQASLFGSWSFDQEAARWCCRLVPVASSSMVVVCKLSVSRRLDCVWQSSCNCRYTYVCMYNIGFLASAEYSTLSYSIYLCTLPGKCTCTVHRNAKKWPRSTAFALRALWSLAFLAGFRCTVPVYIRSNSTQSLVLFQSHYCSAPAATNSYVHTYEKHFLCRPSAICYW